MKTVTIDDVAARAGVSRKTVSRVLNREPKVRPATRQRVEQAIESLHYRPNSSARRLAGNRTYLLGLMYNAGSSYITSIQTGALAACREEHFDLLIHPCDYSDPGLLDSISDLAVGPKVDGLLLTPPISDIDAVRDKLRSLSIPNVLISHESANGTDWTVCTNDEAVSAEVVLHLYRLGHQRIAFVCGHSDHLSMGKRHAGYIRGMKSAGLGVDATLVEAGDNSFESGVRSARRLIDRPRRPTAIVCANDHMAAGVMAALHDSGLAVPGDVSVTGFDDIPLAHQVWPALTTVRQPLEKMSREAARLLLARIRQERPASIHITVDSELVVRSSTGNAPVN